MIRWTDLTRWEFEFPFLGSLISTFLPNHTAPTKLIPSSAEANIGVGSRVEVDALGFRVEDLGLKIEG